MSEGEQPTRMLLSLQSKPDHDAGRVVLTVSRSDQSSVLAGLLTATEARELAYQLLSSANQVERQR